MRFLAVTLGGWVGLRVFMLWPTAVIPAAVSAPRSPHAAAQPPEVREGVAAIGALPPPGDRHGSPAATPAARAAGEKASPLLAVAPAVPHVAVEPPASDIAQTGDGAIPAPLRPAPIARGRSRLAGSAWAIVRGGGNGTLLGGQLGGSQAGARLTYALGEGRRLALSARVAAPLRGTGREAAFGLDWRPTRLPLHLVAEQRLSLDGQRGGPTLMAVGGIDPTPVAAGFRLEGYGQAGAIKRDGVEAFGDGAARLTHRLATVGPLRLDLGAGAWGAAQRSARRLDIGPTLGAVVPVARTALRLTLDWRERVAGNARPGSGPALSVGTDF